jgi:hypothetical protein
MQPEDKVELTPEQLSILLQIVNRGTYAGEQIEIIVKLKQTLIKMLEQKRNNSPAEK